MKKFVSVPSRRVPLVLTGGTEATADVVDELPQIGDVYEGFPVLEVSPSPLTWEDQKAPDVWQYAVWLIRLVGDVCYYVAIHEEEAEKF